MAKFLTRATFYLVATAIPIAQGFASQGPGVGDGTASPELQRGVIFAFIGFFVMILFANIGRRR